MHNYTIEFNPSCWDMKFGTNVHEDTACASPKGVVSS